MSETARGELIPAEWLKEAKPFSPGLLYFAPMDQLIYLNQDCSYRSRQIDSTLDLLLHPYEDRVVGIQLHGVSRR